jgi:hypothetical protein
MRGNTAGEVDILGKCNSDISKSMGTKSKSTQHELSSGNISRGICHYSCHFQNPLRPHTNAGENKGAIKKNCMAINVRETEWGKQEWTIQRNWQYTLEKPNEANKNGQSRETGNKR